MARSNSPYVNDAKPKGVSNADFWTYFDTLPKAERDGLNNAKDGNEARWLIQRCFQLYPPGIDGKATVCSNTSLT